MIRFLCKLGVVCLTGLVPFVLPKVQTVHPKPSFFFLVLFPSGASAAFLDTPLQNGFSRTVPESALPLSPHALLSSPLGEMRAFSQQPSRGAAQTQSGACARSAALEAAPAAVRGPRAAHRAEYKLL